MRTDLHIVGDLHQIIDLTPLADNGASEAGAVDGGIGSDLDVITDLNNAGLGNLEMASLLELVAEST